MPFPTPGDLPYPEIELVSLMYPTLASRFFTTWAVWEAHYYYSSIYIIRKMHLHLLNKKSCDCHYRLLTVTVYLPKIIVFFFPTDSVGEFRLY